MNTKLKGCLLSLILLVTVTAVHAQTRLAEANTSADMDSAIILDSVPVKRNFFRKFLNYFNDANKEKKNKKFDFSIIGGPHYSSDTKLGLDWWLRGFTVPTGTIRFCRLPMFHCTEMFLR